MAKKRVLVPYQYQPPHGILVWCQKCRVFYKPDA